LNFNSLSTRILVVKQRKRYYFHISIPRLLLLSGGLFVAAKGGVTVREI